MPRQRLVERPHLRHVPRPERGKQVGAAVGVEGGAAAGAADGDIGGAVVFGGALTYGYDGAERLSALAIADPTSSGHSNTITLGYNPAGQVTTETRSNDVYAYTGATNRTQDYTANGLNQYASVGGAAFTYDANGNLTSDGTTTYGYDAENRLIQSSGGAYLYYDPAGRLWQTSVGQSNITQFLYDGDKLAAEYDGAGNMLRRYVHSTGEDTPEVWFEGAGLGSPNYLLADHQGSIIGTIRPGLGTLSVNAYDEYGAPAAGNVGRFGYTGQAWLPEVGLWHYKARVYSPQLGRFLQTDPVGYDDQVNLYAYVGNDPVNNEDPSGECPWCVGFVVGAGVEALSEYVETGKVDLSAKGIGRLAIAGAAGALGGGIGAGVARISARLAVRAVANAAAGSAIGAAQTAANAKLAGHGVTAAQLAKGAALGAAGAGAGSAASDAVRGGARVLAEKTGVDIVTRQGQVATSSASSTRDSIIRGGSTAAGNVVGNSPGVADSARNRCVGQRECN